MAERVFAIFLLAAFVPVSFHPAMCQENASAKPEKCELTETDYAVYAALLHDLGGPEDPEESWSGKEFVLVDTTVSFDRGPADEDPKKAPWGFRSKSKETPHDDTIAGFTSKKSDRCLLKAGFGVATYTIVSLTEIDGYFPRTPDRKRDGWKAFYEKHPRAGGFWAFSRPGYNTAGDEALLYVSHSCGWLCGTGHFYLLSKESGGWKVKNRVMLWIS